MSGYRFVAPALLLVLGGCAAGPDYERPELDVPENYIQPVQQGVITSYSIHYTKLYDISSLRC